MILLMLSGCSWLFEVPENQINEPVKTTQPTVRKANQMAPSEFTVGRPSVGGKDMKKSAVDDKKRGGYMRVTIPVDPKEAPVELTNSRGVRIRTGNGSTSDLGRVLSRIEDPVERELNRGDTVDGVNR